MPTYEYSCEKCGRFEEFAPMSAQKREVCPTCETNVERVIGAGAGFLFKGSGFYITDYRSSNYQKKANSEAKPKETPPTAATTCSENGHGSRRDVSSPPAPAAANHLKSDSGLGCKMSSPATAVANPKKS